MTSSTESVLASPVRFSCVVLHLSTAAEVSADAALTSLADAVDADAAPATALLSDSDARFSRPDEDVDETALESLAPLTAAAGAAVAAPERAPDLASLLYVNLEPPPVGLLLLVGDFVAVCGLLWCCDDGLALLGRADVAACLPCCCDVDDDVLAVLADSGLGAVLLAAPVDVVAAAGSVRDLPAAGALATALSDWLLCRERLPPLVCR